ncbi:class I SAM-dependent methyltransferase [Nonomuraea gerenzanensis]|nr:class I SAM-dependent methyltransferase [Nonomuraea gerenzanensis]UBU18933.1 class I SAM-dependent methyltransferase [Nonomuraea gerenzanensis]
MAHMSTMPEDHVETANPSPLNDYDRMAEGYAAENETSLLNAYYERPAMLELAGNVAGRRILDAGCGSGPLFAELRDRGAIITGIDASAGMLEQARQRLGADADLQVADLAGPLPFPDEAFDDVIASLVLHYLEDWGPTLAELRRVLRPGGRLLISIDHPFSVVLFQHMAGKRPKYFETRSRTEEWVMGGQTVQMKFWNRPLHAMTEAFAAAGFRISVISEPPFVPEARDVFPEELREFEPTRTRFLCFLFFVLEAS